MQIVIDSVLTRADLDELGHLLERVPFEDGRATAGWSAAVVKRNAQAAADPALDMWREKIASRIMGNTLVVLAAQPKRVILPMFSRYRVADEYGAHVDEAILDGSRADIAYTLFLADPGAYDGGELVIENPGGDDAHKHAAGSLVLYPASSLHRVTHVTRGVRYAAVGWVRSLVRDAARRELLFDLGTAHRRLFEQHGKTHDVDLLSKTHANLLRMWADD